MTSISCQTLALGGMRDGDFAPGKSAEYCDQSVCLYVCLSVRSHISKTRSIITEFSVHVTVAAARCPLTEVQYIT